MRKHSTGINQQIHILSCDVDRASQCVDATPPSEAYIHLPSFHRRQDNWSLLEHLICSITDCKSHTHTHMRARMDEQTYTKLQGRSNVLVKGPSIIA